MSETQKSESFFVSNSTPGAHRKLYSRYQMDGTTVIPSDSETSRWASSMTIESTDDPALRSEYDPHGEARIRQETGGDSRGDIQDQIEIGREVALRSLSWEERLQDEQLNPPLRRVGRRTLNLLGVQTPTQRDIEHHRGVVDDFKARLGIEDDGDFIEDEAYVGHRNRAVEESFAPNLRTYLEKLTEKRDENSQAFIDYLTRLVGSESLADASDESLVAAYSKFMHDTEHKFPGDIDSKSIEADALQAAELGLRDEQLDFEALLQQQRNAGQEKLDQIQVAGINNTVNLLRQSGTSETDLEFIRDILMKRNFPDYKASADTSSVDA